jgi:putative alpha-1,2-mannosidase
MTIGIELKMMYKKIVTALLLGASFAASAQTKTNLVQYVKPIIGTQRMGHTYPGATVPFGMVQLSPETDTPSY